MLCESHGYWLAEHAKIELIMVCTLLFLIQKLVNKTPKVEVNHKN
jgi:hypothetical protein